MVCYNCGEPGAAALHPASFIVPKRLGSSLQGITRETARRRISAISAGNNDAMMLLLLCASAAARPVRLYVVGSALGCAEGALLSDLTLSFAIGHYSVDCPSTSTSASADFCGSRGGRRRQPWRDGRNGAGGLADR